MKLIGETDHIKKEILIRKRKRLADELARNLSAEHGMFRQQEELRKKHERLVREIAELDEAIMRTKKGGDSEK